jgi:hypothetical protein
MESTLPDSRRIKWDACQAVECRGLLAASPGYARVYKGNLLDNIFVFTTVDKYEPVWNDEIVYVAGFHCDEDTEQNSASIFVEGVKMATAYSYETLVPSYQTKLCHNPDAHSIKWYTKTLGFI